jgi:cupin superfamily acireductone dioxygenase involved in methionine salvage
MHELNFCTKNIIEEEQKQFIEKLHKRFSHHDMVSFSEPLILKNHYHTDLEARLILSGCCTFKIGNTTVDASPGTYIEIGPHVEHSFSFEGEEPLVSLRFFQENPHWEAIYT